MLHFGQKVLMARAQEGPDMAGVKEVLQKYLTTLESEQAAEIEHQAGLGIGDRGAVSGPEIQGCTHHMLWL